MAKLSEKDLQRIISNLSKTFITADLLEFYKALTHGVKNREFKDNVCRIYKEWLKV